MQLNSEQKKAIEIIDKPLIVIAGPGTGKTTLITEKIKYLLNKGFKNDEILAITFTKKAAEEMSLRVENNFLANTFHQFAQELIEMYQNNIPQLDKDFILIEDSVQKVFFLQNIDNFKFNSIEIKNNYNEIAIELQSQISKLKDFGYSLQDFEKIKSDDLQLKLDIFSAYSKYELFKKKNNFVDFSDLLLLVLNLLKENEKIRKEVQKRYKYILVDEFQDTNLVQLEILKLIAKDNITIVGDQKQSIYSFRGANFDNLIEFKNYFKKYKEIFLRQNYRSSKIVLENLNKVICDMNLDEEELEFNLKEKEQGKVEVFDCKNGNSQNSFLIENISKILDKNSDAKIGVLFRRKSELTQVSNYLKSFGINHIAYGKNNFLSDELVKEVLNILRIIDKPKESDIELFRLFKFFNLRDESIKKIYRQSKLKEKPIFVLLKKNFENLVQFEDEKESLILIRNLVSEFVDLYNSKLNILSLVKQILFKFNIYQIALTGNNIEAISNLGQLINFSSNYFTIYQNSEINLFLDICNLSKNLDFENEILSNVNTQVELLTIHNSKGKEFDYVFMPFLNERKFPLNFSRSKFDILNLDTKDKFLDEEKRLFFVGISRAKKELFLSYVKKFDQNKLDSKRSVFLDILNLNVQIFEKEYDEFDLENIEKIKLELVERINKFLFSNNFERAKKEIDLMISLFDQNNSSNVSLNKFLVEKHPDFNFFNEKLKDCNNCNQIKIEPSSMVYSVSQLKTYETCPKKYLYSYIYRIPSEPKHFFDFGTSLHSVFEEIVNLIGKLPKEAVYANAISFLRKNWISKGYVSATQEKEYFEKGVKAVQEFIDKELELRNEDIDRELVSQEEKFFLNLNGRRVMGFIDRIDKVGKNFEILDYKTSNSMMTKSQLKDDLQLFVYALACKDIKGKFPKNVGLWYVVHNEIVKVDFSDIDTEKLKKKALNLINGIEENKFHANPSFFGCKFCDYAKICKDSIN